MKQLNNVGKIKIKIQNELSVFSVLRGRDGKQKKYAQSHLVDMRYILNFNGIFGY